MTDLTEMGIVRATIAGVIDAHNCGMTFCEMQRMAYDAETIEELDALSAVFVDYTEEPEVIIIDVIV